VREQPRWATPLFAGIIFGIWGDLALNTRAPTGLILRVAIHANILQALAAILCNMTIMSYKWFLIAVGFAALMMAVPQPTWCFKVMSSPRSLSAPPQL